MNRFNPGPPPLTDEAAAVLAAIADEPDPLGLRLNELAGATGLPTGHVGRHLRTLEGDRLASFGAGRWRLTLRGRRIAGDLAAAAAEAAPAPRPIP
jgi:DNA-binding IclR family transcriptional regulator